MRTYSQAPDADADATMNLQAKLITGFVCISCIHVLPRPYIITTLHAFLTRRMRQCTH